MQLDKLCVACFSPTHTSMKIARAIADGMHIARREEIDLTTDPADTPISVRNAICIVAAPVYGGLVAPLAVRRIARLRAENSIAIPVVVYGNRDYEDALVQLRDLLHAQGFTPLCGAAFVGEHSYSTPGTPIAEGRPDTQDLAEAAAFGARIGRKLAHGETGPIDAAKLREPHTPLLSKLRFIRFVLGYRRRQKRTPAVLLPAGDAARCTQCGRCVALCPTQAIARGDELHTDPARCIRCCACVKGCAFGARTFETPFAAVLSRNFARRKPPVTIM